MLKFRFVTCWLFRNEKSLTVYGFDGHDDDDHDNDGACALQQTQLSSKLRQVGCSTVDVPMMLLNVGDDGCGDGDTDD